MPAPFAVCFIGHSYPIPGETFTSAGPSQAVLDVVSTVTPQFWNLKEIALFLTTPDALNPALGLGLYIKVANGDWQYRGCVHGSHPSEAMPLVWPEIPEGVVQGTPGAVLIVRHLNTAAQTLWLRHEGVSLEPVAELQAKESAKMGAREDFAKRVAYNLFRFIESFGGKFNSDQIVVPSNILDQWFRRFQEKFRRDPDFLSRQEMPV